MALFVDPVLPAGSILFLFNFTSKRVVSFALDASETNMSQQSIFWNSCSFESQPESGRMSDFTSPSLSFLNPILELTQRPNFLLQSGLYRDFVPYRPIISYPKVS